MIPRPPARLLGRASSLERLGTCFDEGGRLATVVGIAGVGKTRLALEYGVSQEARFESQGGAHFCDLSDCATPEDVQGVVGRELGLAPRAKGSADALASGLRGLGPTLLILDNFEQLVDSSTAVVGDWIAACPELRILVTSRERLRLRAEHVVELSPLELPAGVADHSAAAVQLWVACRRREQPGYELSESEAGLVVEVVTALDGIPLAIELAAARAGLVGLKEIAERITERFDLLSRGPRDLSPRQQTLEAALDWSWNLLSDLEREVLASVSVFQGGFDLEAAKLVVGDPLVVSADEVVDVIEALREKSLLISAGRRPESARFGLYATVREFASRKLELGRKSALRLAHARYYAALSIRLSDAVRGPEGHVALAALTAELGNLTVVVEAARDSASTDAHLDAALQCLTARHAVFTTRGPLGADLKLLAEVVDAAVARDGVDRAHLTEALRVRGLTRCRLGLVDEAAVDLDEARELATELGATDLQAAVEVERTFLGLRRRDLDGAAVAGRAAIDLAVEARNPVLEGAARGWLGAVCKEQGDSRSAREEYERSIDLAKRADCDWLKGTSHTRMAILSLEQGRLDDAHAHARDALAIHRRFRDGYLEGVVQCVLGAIDHARGALEAARTSFQVASPILRAAGDIRFHGVCVGYLGLIEYEVGETEMALERLREADEMLSNAGDPRYGAFFRAALATAQGQIGREAEARKLLESAEAAIQRASDPLLADSVTLFRCLLELVLAGEDGRPKLQERAQSLLAAARGTLEQCSDDASVAPVAQSSDLRTTVRLVDKALAALDAPSADESTQRLRLDSLGRWFECGGGRVDLRRRQAMRRILVRLAHNHLSPDSKPLDSQALIASGWPNERILPDAALNRLYVTVSRLREIGLGGALKAGDEGYFLDSALQVTLVPEAES